MNITISGLLLVIAAAATVLWMQNSANSPSGGSKLTDSSSVLTTDDESASATQPPAGAPAGSQSDEHSRTESRVAGSAADDGSVEASQIRAAEREAFFQRFDFSQIGRQRLDDGEFNALVAYLRNDAELFAQFLDEYRLTTDPLRARRLAQVLDQFDDAAIVSLGEELLFSGTMSAQVAGLDLLGGQQAKNPQAREIISQVLELETSPEVISAALNALATPASVTPEQRETLLNQFAMHFSSADSGVRRRSLILMERWAGQANMNTHFVTALQDPDERVRRSAVLALTSSKHRDDRVFQALLDVVQDSSMHMLSRRAALAALEKDGLSSDEQQRLLALLSSTQ